MCLDGASQEIIATQKIMENLANCKDLRDTFRIHQQGYKDLNEHLLKHNQTEQEHQEQKNRGMRK